MINSRKKGHGFERKVAQDMRTIGYPDARRQLEYHKDDANGVDLQNTPPFKIQCKAMKKQPVVHDVMDKIQVSASDVPVVVYKVDGKGTFMAFRYEDGLRLMKAFREV